MSAPTKANPYYGPLNTAFTRLVFVNGAFQQLAGYWNLNRTEIERNISRHRRSSAGPASGAALVIRDLTEWPPDGWARHFSVGAHQRRGRRFLSALDEIVSANAAWAVSQSFEAFERFLRDSAAIYLKRQSTTASLPAWAPPNARASIRPSSRRLVGYRVFVRQVYGGADDLLKRFRKSVPALAASERRNNRAVDLQVWFRVASEVRHAVVHSSSTLTPRQLAKLGAPERSLLRDAFPGTACAEGYRLRLSRQAGGDAVDRFAEYALLIFKELSQQESLDWNVFRSVRIRV